MTKLSKYEKETIINWNEAERRSETQTGRVQSQVSAAVSVGAQHHRGQRNLCDREIPVVCPPCPAVQRRTVGSCQRVRQTAWISGFAYRKGKCLITGQITAKCRVCTRHFHSLFIQGYQVSSTIEDEKCPIWELFPRSGERREK